MAYRVKIAAPAERDLERAVAYIAEVLAAPSAAVSLLDEYERVLDLLAGNERWSFDEGFCQRLSVVLFHRAHLASGVNRLLLHGRDLIYLTSP